LYKEAAVSGLKFDLLGIYGTRPTVWGVRRLLAVLSVSALALAACDATGGGGTTTAAVDPTATTLSPVAGDEAATTSSSEVAATDGATASTASGGPLAPDFTLTLGDGGTYTLSEGAKPVYLVFWAEW
jgi:hypothetical protein